MEIQSKCTKKLFWRLDTNANLILVSAIGQHMLDNKNCAEKFKANRILILATGQSSLHPATLKATFIKSLERFRCCQKKIYGLKLSRLRRDGACNQFRALFLLAN